MSKHSGRIFFVSLAFAACLCLFSLVLSACTSTSEETVTQDEQASPELTVDSSQVAVYNGQPQPISYYYSGAGKPEIIYYTSQEARNEDREGRSTAPIRAGTYYVRAKCTVGNANIIVHEVYAEYRILKMPVKIEAEEIQHAYYNGNPKRVRASAEPPVLLSYSYYPNRELRETAQRTVEKSTPGEDSIQLLTKSYSGYRRVDRTPIEAGTYYVWVYFPGDENHEAANADVEFTILPRS